MKITTYDSLITEVKNWFNRADISDTQYHSFTYFAGSMANQLLRVAPMEWTSILDVSPDGHVVIPPDFLELKSITAAYNDENSVPLQRVAWDQFVNYLNGATDADTQPTYFGEQGGFWFLGPLPKVGTKVTVHYFRTMPDIDVQNQTNWLVQLSPLTYLYGTLHFAYLYVMDEERAQYWLDKMNGELTRLQLMYDSAKYTGSALRVRDKYYPEGTPYGL